MDNSVMNNGRMEYTITWFIENYSYNNQKQEKALISPEFIADSLEGTALALELYPRGGFKVPKGIIPLYFTMPYLDQSRKNLALKFELEVLAADRKSALHSVERDLRWNGKFGYGVEDFLRIDDLRQNYLHQDTLIVRCRMWSDKQTIRRTGHCSARTRIGTEKISFLHKVKDFSGLKPNEKNTHQVQSPSKTGCSISSSLYFLDEWSFEGTIIVEIEASNKNYILRKQKVSLLDRSGNTVESREADNRFDDSITAIRKVPLSITRQIILHKKNEYLPNNELSVICECTFSTGVELEKIEEIQYELPVAIIPASEEGYNAAEKLSTCRSALEDLKTIYNNQRLTDIELKTKTKSFPAHKLVLCARSSVFDAMLTNDMKEKNTGCIHADDLENDTVQQLLLFLYSDKLENLQWESAIKLYYAGDKYAIEKLKVLCSSYLIGNLNTSTASELLLLADTHNDTDLKKFVEDFILLHEDEVFSSDEWEKLMDTNPQLVMKTMHLKYKRKKERK